MALSEKTICPYCNIEVERGKLCEQCGRLVPELPPMFSVIQRRDETFFGMFGEAVYFCRTCRTHIPQEEVQAARCPRCNTPIKVEYPKTKTVVAIGGIIAAICLYLTIRHPFFLPVTVPTLIAFLFVMILGLVLGLK